MEKTTKEDQKAARSVQAEVHEVSKTIQSGRGRTVSIKVHNAAKAIIIPKKAFVLLLEILDNMADGKSFALLLSEAELSTQQAADILKVSRPHVVSLLEKGEIPFIKVGTHRRILLEDLLEYDKKLDKTRNEKLAYLAKHAQEHNLGYE